MNLTEIGLRIKKCRKQQGITQEKLAEAINVSPHYIYEIEKGLKTMSLSTLMILSIELNTSTDYILFGIANKTSQSDFQADTLTTLTEHLPLQKRESLAAITKAILPFLK